MFIFLGRLPPAMSQQCQSLPTAFLGIPRLPSCRERGGRDRAGQHRRRSRSCGRREAPATCLSAERGSRGLAARPRPSPPRPSPALPAGGAPRPSLAPSLPRSLPPRGRWRPGGAAAAAPPAAGRTRSAPEPAGRDRPERCSRRRGTPARSPSGTRALPARRGLLVAGEVEEEEGSAVVAARPGPARRAAEQSERGRGKLCRPGATVTGGGRSVRGGRGVGGGGGAEPGQAVRRALLPAPEPPVRPGGPAGSPLRGARAPAPCSVAGRARGRGFRSPARLLLADAAPPTRGWERRPLPHRGCRPSEPPVLRPPAERGPGPELRSRPRSSFVYPTASCWGRRWCRVRRDRC